ncbi:hypothetical protein VTN77DRAFT_4798 [Rasamsonia byssochlamydoides]|uniref:uncharacterized protein n=1 Tax=Rasamsonia byssochlamydoides TaxID=89139 RepID=UPI003743C3C8
MATTTTTTSTISDDNQPSSDHHHDHRQGQYHHRQQIQTQQPSQTQNTTSSPTQTAFISGPLDTGPNQSYFVSHYIPLINAALSRGDKFVIGPIPSGVDADALAYLLSQPAVSASPAERITIFVTREEDRLWGAKFRSLGVKVHVVQSANPRARDAAMTRASNYDILRWRTPEEARALYGAAWREGHVTNTERNWRRRRGLLTDAENEEERENEKDNNNDKGMGMCMGKDVLVQEQRQEDMNMKKEKRKGSFRDRVFGGGSRGE